MADEPLTSTRDGDPSGSPAAVASPAQREVAKDATLPRGRRLHRDLTKGSIPRNLWFLAWPQVIEGAMNVVDQVLDLIWAGIISFRAIAGIGVAQSYTQLVMTARQGLDVGSRAMISRAVGAGNLPLANHIALQSFTLSGAVSIFIATVGILLTVPLLRLVGVSDEIIAQGSAYMRFQFLASAGISFRMMAGAALQASGDALTPMKATMVTRITHIALSPVLVFGWLFFPSFGIAGAAIAGAIAQAVGAAMNFYALFKGTSRLHLTWEGYHLDFALLWQMAKLGAPASVTTMERALSNIILIRFVTPFGDHALAAYSLIRRVEMVSFMGSMGLGQASGILVGQNLGAKQPQRAKQSVLWALLYVASIQVVVGTLIFSFPGGVASVFSRDTELLSYVVVWLRIQTLGYLFQGAGMVFTQSFNTAGDTLPPMLITFAVLVVELPLAWMLSQPLGLGQYGVAWAVVIPMVMRPAFYVPYFFYGRWLRVKVI